ncbi:MAG: DUF6476 family protein [Marinibacterium sp.]
MNSLPENDLPDPKPDPVPEPANLRFLRRLVTVLTMVMIGGLLTVVALLVIRGLRPAPLPLPDQIDLPAGARAMSVTYAPDWILVLSDSNELYLFDRVSGRLHQTVSLDGSGKK